MAVTINVLNAGNMMLTTVSSEPHWEVHLPNGESVNLYGQKTDASNENLSIDGMPAKGYLTYIPGDTGMGEPNIWSYQFSIEEKEGEGYSTIWEQEVTQNYANDEYLSDETLEFEALESNIVMRFTWIS